jgi:hypothetical protein
MHRLVLTGFDVYGYATFTHLSDEQLHSKVSTFIDLLQEEVHPLFPLRTVPLRIREYTPTAQRIGPDQQRALQVQLDAVQAWNEELGRRFSNQQLEQKIFEHRLLS